MQKSVVALQPEASIARDLNVSRMTVYRAVESKRSPPNFM
jgi:DNA-binding GntR family transcriptional regulator